MLQSTLFRARYQVERGHVECEGGDAVAVALAGTVLIGGGADGAAGSFTARVSRRSDTGEEAEIGEAAGIPLFFEIEEDTVRTVWRVEAEGELQFAMGVCTGEPVPPPALTQVEDAVPLMDMGPGSTYLGFEGGLYPDGAATPPPRHHEEGLRRARAVQPLDVEGRPDPDHGFYVLLSIGMSNTSQEFCSRSSSCEPSSFVGQAAEEPGIAERLVILNGARSGQTAARWTSESSGEYDRIRDQVLVPRGLSEAQVQVAWVKLAHPRPLVALPSPHADAYRLLESLGDVVRALRTRYPNLQQIFLSSRTYAGYATTRLNPEPFAYESGFAVKWLIEAQIAQMQGGEANAVADDLSYAGDGAAWLAWGPYLWANGTQPRSDGLVWNASDFRPDGTHPAEAGREKVGRLLLEFFRTSPYTRCWFLAGGTCG